ncbi:RNA polymerase sigma factor [Polystyrenella longa]|uniref:RNA polymerase sigma factor n=1 Tax=Polystyrenella longa TaxID=2528007 RepID=A0A518CPP0_9PLAN|nr:ECF-type sigma factor [Polystyrenella longa]QDU81189.1 RNA polymerase sigma factor [Polystyrenella longa]
MSDDHSVTNWLHALREENNNDAAQEIWNRFQKQLIGVATRQLGTNNRMTDADDAVNDAFASFCSRYEEGQYPDLNDRDGLWSLLLTMTENKARKQLRRELADKRGAGNVRGDSIFYSPTKGDGQGGFDRIASVEPSPEDVLTLKESMEELMGKLTDEECEIALLRMQAYANTEIAEKTKHSLATVERRLKQIREKWSASTLLEA